MLARLKFLTNGDILVTTPFGWSGLLSESSRNALYTAWSTNDLKLSMLPRGDEPPSGPETKGPAVFALFRHWATVSSSSFPVNRLPGVLAAQSPPPLTQDEGL